MSVEGPKKVDRVKVSPANTVITEPQAVTIPTRADTMLSGGKDWVIKYAAIGGVAASIAGLFNPYVTKFFVGEVPTLTEAERKEMEKEKKILEDSIARIEKRQAEFGEIIVPSGTTENKRFWGAPVEMFRRWLGKEQDSAPSVKILRAKLNTLDFKDRTYSAFQKLSFLLTFVIASYYLAEPIEALVIGRRRRKTLGGITEKATTADKLLHGNDLLLEQKIMEMKAEYLDLIIDIVAIQKKHLSTDLSSEEFNTDLAALHQKLDSVLAKLEAVNNE